MITLHVFGPAFGLPDASPFCTKAAVLLKLAGLAFRTDTSSLSKAPKGKLPYMTDRDGAVIADSTFIRRHLERTYGIDFDTGLSAEQRAVGWTLEKMCEDHFYWGGLYDRWMDDGNFARGPAHFFDAVPAPARPFVKRLVRRRFTKGLNAQGTGRHTAEERAWLLGRDVDVLATMLGDKSCLFGDEPTGTDATAFAFVAGALCPVFTGAARDAAAKAPTLVAYRDRLMSRFYPGGAA